MKINSLWISVIICFSTFWGSHREVGADTATRVGRIVIPTIQGISKPCDPSLWDSQGLTAKVFFQNPFLTTQGKNEPYKSPQAHIGWTMRGIRILLAVPDDSIQESDDPNNLLIADNIQISMSGLTKRSSQYRAIISPGLNGTQSSPRVEWEDFRDDSLRKSGLQGEFNTVKAGDGYLMDVSLPWTNFGQSLSQGRSITNGDAIGLQLVVNLFDSDGKRQQYLLYPNFLAPNDPANLLHMTLSQDAKVRSLPLMAYVTEESDVTRKAAFGEYRRSLRPRVHVLGDASLIGKTVDLYDPSDKSPKATSLASKKMVDFGQYSSGEVDIPIRGVGHKKSTMEYVDVNVDSADPQTIPILNTPEQNLLCFLSAQVTSSTRLFTKDKFPEIRTVAPLWVYDYIGSSKISVSYYDDQYNEVEKPDTIGRYGRIIKIITDAGREYSLFHTICRTQDTVNWESYKGNFAEFFITTGVSREESISRQDSIDYTYKNLSSSTYSFDSAIGAMLGCYYARDPKMGIRSDKLDEIDREWWLGLKIRLGIVQTPVKYYYPKEYNKDTAEKWPLLVFLHGAGECGEGGNDLKRLEIHGPLRLVKTFDGCPFVIMAPQCRPGENWSTIEIRNAINKAVRENNVDPSRIYLTGLSSGGNAVWRTALDFPELVTAMAPVSSAPELGEDTASRLRGIPIWFFIGGKDGKRGTLATELEATLKGAQCPAKLTIYQNENHDAWTKTYMEPDLYQWFLESKKR